jgi:Na+-driven multidrug efflux pump
MFYYDLGLLGAGLAVSASNIVQAVIIHIALYVYDEVRVTLAWPEWNEQQW